MKEEIYNKALKALKPLRLTELAIQDMIDKDINENENAELIPTYYEFICKMIEVLEGLKKDMKKYMSAS